MPLHFCDLSSQADRKRRAEIEQEARALWALDDWSARQRRLERLDARLWLEPSPAGCSLHHGEQSARPLAELVVRSAPEPLGVRLGRAAVGVAEALAYVQVAHGVELAGSRVRVGVTRGHLLEVVLSVPLDIRADDEALQCAAEGYLEALVGEQLLDSWVASVGVVRSPRRGAFLVLSDVTTATTFPLEQAGELIQRGIVGLSAQLPRSLLALPGAEEGAAWTALELEPGTVAPQGERSFAATWLPEALKAALEGMPFDSRRFTRGDEVFAWLSWTALDPRGEARLLERERWERRVAEFCGRGNARLAGSGFGPRRDYLDLLVRPELAVLSGLLEALGLVPLEEPAEGEPAVELGFYDSIWAEERLRLRRTGD